MSLKMERLIVCVRALVYLRHQDPPSFLAPSPQDVQLDPSKPTKMIYAFGSQKVGLLSFCRYGGAFGSFDSWRVELVEALEECDGFGVLCA